MNHAQTSVIIFHSFVMGKCFLWAKYHEFTQHDLFKNDFKFEPILGIMAKGGGHCIAKTYLNTLFV
jgi:hypothetical protein